MKQGKTLNELAKELERQRLARKDFIADTAGLEVVTDSNGVTKVMMGFTDISGEFVISDIAHQQIATRLQIPFRYYQKMRLEYPELLDKNINSWFARTNEKRMLRTLDNRLRAFLSDRYRRLDNLELAEAVLPILNEIKGLEIISSEITETHMYIKVINKKLKADVGENDIVQAGMVISNSEVGLGSLKVEPLVYRLVCKNGLIVKDYTQKKYHVGKQVDSEESAYEIYRDETLAADDKAFFMKVQDTVRCAVDETKFLLSVNKLIAVKSEHTGDNPIKTVELLADKYVLNQNERGSILRHFIMGGDDSRFGLVNAVTRASQDIEDYNRATELERLGGELLLLPIKSEIILSDKSSEMSKPIKNITPNKGSVISIAR